MTFASLSPSTELVEYLSVSIPRLVSSKADNRSPYPSLLSISFVLALADCLMNNPSPGAIARLSGLVFSARRSFSLSPSFLCLASPLDSYRSHQNYSSLRIRFVIVFSIISQSTLYAM